MLAHDVAASRAVAGAFGYAGQSCISVQRIFVHEDVFDADHMPYGGVKASGIGREGPRYAIEDFTEPRWLVLQRSSAR